MIGLNPILNDISAESISFQYDSKFGDKLSAMFQKIIDFRDDTLRTHSTRGANFVEEIIKIFSNFYTKTIRRELVDIVKQETGIELTTIILNRPDKVNGSFAVSIDLSTGSLMEILSEVTSGQVVFDNFEFDKEGIENLFDVADSLKHNTGKFDHTKFSQNIRATLYLDIGFAFIPDLLYIGIDKKYRLSAKEISSIVLHEIGHIVTLIEYVSYNGYAGLYCNQELDKIKNDENKIKTMINSKTLIPSLKKHFSLVKKHMPSVSKMAFKRIELLESIKLEFSKKKVRVRVMRILLRLFSILMQLLTPIVILGNMIALCYVLVIRKGVESLAYSVKNIDQNMNREMITDRSLFAAERLADEYVVLHRYGSHLSSAFKKILHIIELTQYQGEPAMLGDFYSNRGFQYIVGGLSVLFKIMNPIICFINSPLYEMSNKRIKRLFLNSYSGLKKAKLDDKTKASLLKELDNTHNEYKQFQKQSLGDVCMYLRKFEMIISVPFKELYHALNETNYEEYSNLLEDIDSILGNSLYTASARLSIIK